jgi:carbon monoxide dehydrogenase subunit G
MLMYVALALVAAVAVLLLVAATRPDSFTVKREATVAAAPDRVFALIEDFHAWLAWSPWEGRDPNLQRTYAGAERGPGASYAWSGNKEVGSGKMTVTATEPARKVVIDLEFITPFPAKNVTTFALAPDGAGTRVTWTMEGKSTFMFKLMGLVMNMDAMIGKDFEAGLAKMNQAAKG